MMGFLVFLGVVVGVLIFFGIVCLVIYQKFKKYSLNLGYTPSEIKDMLKKSDEEAKYRPKSITGMTDILSTKIEKDYSGFNSSEFFNKVQASLLGIFNSLSDEKVSKIEELNLIDDRLEEMIRNNVGNNIKETYSGVTFNKHAIKNYQNIGGALTITVASSLAYYYKKEINGKVKEDYKDYKKQTSYTTKFVHIYDPDKYASGKSHLAAHCPNCGAILSDFKGNKCDYCGSGVEPINLKSWFISEFYEDKR